MNDTEDEYLTVSQVAKRLGTSPHKLYPFINQARAGRRDNFPPFQIISNDNKNGKYWKREYLFPRKELIEWEKKGCPLFKKGG